MARGGRNRSGGPASCWDRDRLSVGLGERRHHHLAVLVEDIGVRPPGSPAHRVPAVGQARLTVAPNPYSPPVQSRGRAGRVGRLAELEELALRADTMLVLLDGSCREQVTLEVVRFPSPPEHQEPTLEDPHLVIFSSTVPASVGGALAAGDGLICRVGPGPCGRV